MRLIELINSLHWDDIEHEFISQNISTEKSHQLYHKLFVHLKTLVPIQNDPMRICFEKRTDPSIYDEPFIEVLGRDGQFKKNQEVSTTKIEEEYGLQYSRWEKWLGTTIDKTTLNNYSFSQIIALCLKEMTFVAFDQDTIHKSLTDLQQQIIDLHQMTEEEYKKNTFTNDEVFEMVRSKLKAKSNFDK